MPELALHFLRLDLEVGDGGSEFRVPIDQALVAIEQPVAIKLDEHLEHRGGEARIHGEALIRPVAGRAETAELSGDRAARLGLPLPDMLDEGLAAHVGALDSLAFQVALDHHLGGDPGMVHPDHPERILPLQPGVADEDVLERQVERVADMERAGDVGRRDDDGERLGLGPLGSEQALLLPAGVPAGFDFGRVEGLGKLGHVGRLDDGVGAANPGRRHTARHSGESRNP